MKNLDELIKEQLVPKLGAAYININTDGTISGSGTEVSYLVKINNLSSIYLMISYENRDIKVYLDSRKSSVLIFDITHLQLLIQMTQIVIKANKKGIVDYFSGIQKIS